ncbi:ABC transporter permease [bacterium]|nr:ABC transporter permease [bacterium]
MTFLLMGFRNLFRQKRRTATALMVITFGIGCLLLTMGHTAFIDWGLREQTIHSETGHLQLFNDRFFQKEEETILEFGIDDAEEIAASLQQFLEVQLVQSRISLMGLISNGDKSVAFIGDAIEPEKERQLRTMFADNGSARFDSLIVHRGEEVISLGAALARSLNVQYGDWVTLMTSTVDGALNAVDLRVVDTFRDGTVEYEKRAVNIPLPVARRLLMTDRVGKLIVTLDKTEHTLVLRDRIITWAAENGYGLTVKTWKEQAAYYRQVVQFFRQITGFISLILLIIVFFASVNTIVMALVERTREIGTLLSVGTSRAQTVMMFWCEGLLLGLIGSVLATLFALAVSALVNGADIMLPPAPGSSSGYPLSIRNEFAVFVRVAAATVVASGFSSLLPALRVTRMKIVDALGHI